MSIARQLFREMRPLFRMLDEPFTGPSLYSGFQPPLAGISHFDAMTTSPAVDVSEEGDKYKVNADLPGIPKDNIELRIGDNGRSITIEGKVFEKGEAKTDKTSAEAASSKADFKVATKPEESTSTLALSSERPFTRNVSFTRTIWLPRPVDSKHVTAKLDHGVLRVGLNKIHDKGSTTIPIN